MKTVTLKITGKSAAEYEILILCLRQESPNPDRNRQGEWLEQHSSRTRTGITLKLPVSPETHQWLTELAEDFSSWGNPYGGFDSDRQFRCRPFQRCAQAIREALNG